MSEETLSEVPRKEKDFGRRLFLKLAGATVALFVLFREIKLPEGKPSQQVSQALRLILKLIREKPIDGERKDVLAAWLKFNGVAEWGDKKGYVLASSCVRHFLYGDGEDFNIDKLFTDSVLKFNRKGEKDKNIVLAWVFGDLITKKFESFQSDMSLENEQLPLSQEELEELINSSQEKRVNFSFTTSSDSVNKDVYYSLNRFTLRVAGIAKARLREDGQLEVVLTSVEIQIYDEYDWLKGSLPVKTGAYLGVEIDNFFYRVFGLTKTSENLRGILGDDRFDKLYFARPVVILDEEGELLVKYRLAKNFIVKANYSLPEIHFEVPWSD